MTLLLSTLSEFLGSVGASLVIAGGAKAIHGLRARRRNRADGEIGSAQASNTTTHQADEPGSP